MTAEHPGEIRVLGAIRSVNQCQECHNVRDGTLLGAFTYRLNPTTMAMTGRHTSTP